MKHTVALKQNHEFRRLYSKGRSAVSPYFCPLLPAQPPVIQPPGHHHRRQTGQRSQAQPGTPPDPGALPGEEQALLPGYDIVVVARTRVIYGKYADLQRSFRRLTEKLELRRGREAGEAL